MKRQSQLPMIQNHFERFKRLLVFMVVALLSGCATGDNYFQPPRTQDTLRPEPRLNVFVMPKTPLNLSRKKVLMIPAYMAGNQEEIWGNSVTSLVRSILLQEGIFGTLALNPDNHLDKKDMLRIAHEKGFDYILEIILPGIIEPAGDSSGWVGMNIYIISTKKGYSLWQIYGETQLIPRPTFHGFFQTDQYVPAPTVGQGLEAITRSAARIIRGS